MASPLDIELTCRPHRDGNSLVFDYELRNRSRTAIHAADAFRVVDYDTHLARADEQIAIIMLHGDNEAVVGKFIPPPPLDQRMVVPVIPLTVLVEPGTAIARSLVVQLPLVESSPL